MLGTVHLLPHHQGRVKRFFTRNDEDRSESRGGSAAKPLEFCKQLHCGGVATELGGTQPDLFLLRL